MMKKGIIISIGLIALPAMASANVIWPMFLTPYVHLVVIPFIGAWILLSEAIAGILVNAKEKKWKRLVLKIVSANIISSLCGYGIGRLLSNISPNSNELEDGNFMLYAALSYLITYLLSIVIEGLFLNILKRKDDLYHPYRTSVFCNSISYAGIGIYFFLLR